MLKTASNSGLEHCVQRNDCAAVESSLVENDPGMIKTSNCGAFAKEFCALVRLGTSTMNFGVPWMDRKDVGACVNLYLPARLS
jgi:hypothetical protein